MAARQEIAEHGRVTKRDIVRVGSAHGGNNTLICLKEHFADGHDQTAASIRVPSQSGDKELDAARAEELQRQIRAWKEQGIVPEKTVEEAVPAPRQEGRFFNPALA